LLIDEIVIAINNYLHVYDVPCKIQLTVDAE